MPARPGSVANNGTNRNRIEPRNSARAPRGVYSVARPGSVANNGTKRNLEMKFLIQIQNTFANCMVITFQEGE